MKKEDLFSKDEMELINGEMNIFENQELIEEYANSLGMDKDEMLVSFKGLNLQELVEVNNVNSGVLFLVKGYLEYAKYVLINRVLPNLYDGLKPVQRYILWAHYLRKGKGMHKNGGIVTDVMEMHPHGDATIYGALVRMASSNGSFMVSLLEGQGNLGKYYKKKDYAAYRYTGSRLNSYANEMFQAQDVVPMIKSPDYSSELPSYLTPSYPYILCASASSGIGVGASTLIPTFNVNDVLGLVEEYIETKDIVTDIVPDFSSGGSIIKNSAEIKKLMKTGKAKLRLRGDIKVQNKELVIDTFPEGVTVDSLEKELIDLQEKHGYDEIKEIKKLSNKDGGEISIDTKRGTDLGQLINVIYSKTSMEKNYNANMLVVVEDNIKYLGVHQVIEEWVAWRKQVIKENLELSKKTFNERARMLEPFIKLLNDEVEKPIVVDMVTNKDTSLAKQYVMELLDVEKDIATFIVDSRASSYSKVDKHQIELDSVYANLKRLEEEQEDSMLEQAILKDMARVRAVIGDRHPRKTEETNQVFKITYLEDTGQGGIADDEEVYYLLTNSRTLTKYYNRPSDVEIEAADQFIKAENGEQLIALTDNAEVIRIYGDEIAVGMNGRTDLLTYAEALPNSNVYFIARAIDETYLLTHSNGYISYFNPVNFKSDKLRIRLLMSSVHRNVSNMVGYEKLEEGVNYSLVIQTQQEEEAIYSINTLPTKSEKGMVRLPKAKDLVIIDYNLVPTEVVENKYDEDVVNTLYNFPTHLEDRSIILDDETLREVINSFYNERREQMEDPTYFDTLINVE